MSFRSVVITNSCNLELKNNNLIIKMGEEFPIPIEDISVLLIEDISIRVTTRLLNKLSENNVMTVICDEKHLPSTIVMPLNTHYKSYKVMKNQLTQSAAFSKRIWQSIIKQKIYNQSRGLNILEIDDYEFLEKLSDKVESGDKGNKEAIATKYYFQKLFGDDFNRNDVNGINSALNYGYTIMRSAVARTLVMYGFNTAFGVHHCNELNSFNLADDFMEPLRPIVDMWVYNNMKIDDELTKEKRVALIDLVNTECRINNQNHSIINAIEKMISSYTTACNTKDYRLLRLPENIPMVYHYYE